MNRKENDLIFEQYLKEDDISGNNSGMDTSVQYEIDNRDIYTTWLRIPGTNKYLEVDVWELVQNAIENANLPNEEDVLANLDTTLEFANQAGDY